ncbi:hypothetical protein [Ornithinimicrobium panacihumi]|uniref:hypothetical protein n=1 Tax=Ornithinimicrobium panacihumi TaxID=2008449 RepID=UPI003F89F3B9
MDPEPLELLEPVEELVVDDELDELDDPVEPVEPVEPAEPDGEDDDEDELSSEPAVPLLVVDEVELVLEPPEERLSLR